MITIKKTFTTIGALILLSGCQSVNTDDVVTVDHIVDPLTFTTTNGETIRFIGARSPLITDPIQCYGKEAMQAAESLIGKEVRLEIEPLFTNAEDGALPRYVFLILEPAQKNIPKTGTGAEVVTGTGIDVIYDDKEEEEEPKEILVNERALEMGTAFPLVSEEMMYGQRMLSAARYASATKKGLWGACEVTPVETAKGKILNTQAIEDCIIKGKVLENGSKIYRTKDCSAYKETIVNRTKGGQWFCAEDTAEDAGFTKASDCE
jgi:endonuclease YncB( thermonuclease family)